MDDFKVGGRALAMAYHKESPRWTRGPSEVVSSQERSEDSQNAPPLQLRSRRYFAEALATAGATSFAALALARHFGRPA
jgi:hypothetical protein